MILELNARPGLNIQIANRSGLLERLRRGGGGAEEEADPASRVAKAREWFAG